MTKTVGAALVLESITRNPPAVKVEAGVFVGEGGVVLLAGCLPRLGWQVWVVVC